MNLTSLLQAAYQRTGQGTSPGTEVVTRFTQFANSAYKEIMGDPILSGLRRRTIPAVTTSGSPYLALPTSILDIYYITDRTNQFPLEERDQGWIRSQDPGRTNTGANPYAYAIVDRSSPVARQPSDSSQLYIKSSDAADTTQVAYIEVVTSQGYTRQSNVTLTGTTALTIGPANSIDIEDLYLATAPVGEVTLLEDSGAGTELARIGIGQTRSRYLLLELFPIPGTVTLYVDCRVRITDLVNATDEPLIEDEDCEAIVWGMVKREFYKREKTKLGDDAWRNAGPYISRMHLRAHKKAASSGDSYPTRWSQLGPYFPPGS